MFSTIVSNSKIKTFVGKSDGESGDTTNEQHKLIGTILCKRIRNFELQT